VTFISEPRFRIETQGRWTPEQLDVLSDAHNRLARALEGHPPAVVEPVRAPKMGRNTLIVGDRALAAIGLVVFVALLWHTIFWSFVLPFGSIVS